MCASLFVCVLMSYFHGAMGWSMIYKRVTPAVYMLCVEITCRVQDLPAIALHWENRSSSFTVISFKLIGRVYCGHNC